MKVARGGPRGRNERLTHSRACARFTFSGTEILRHGLPRIIKPICAVLLFTFSPAGHFVGRFIINPRFPRLYLRAVRDIIADYLSLRLFCITPHSESFLFFSFFFSFSNIFMRLSLLHCSSRRGTEANASVSFVDAIIALSYQEPLFATKLCADGQ